MTPSTPLTIRLNPQDDVRVALAPLEPGTSLAQEEVTCRDPIPAGHKVAIRSLRAGNPVRKYGQIIGFASRDIRAGEHVHTHNLEMRDFIRDHAIGQDAGPTPRVPEQDRAGFEGIVREDGRVGTRNYIGVMSTVNCSASVARFIAAAFTEERMRAYPHVDGVVSLIHGTGCGMAAAGEGFLSLQRSLAGFARHPNFAGILLVGLGCEVNYVDCLLENMKLEVGPLLRTVNIQEAGGTRKTVEAGVETIKEMLAPAEEVRRTPVPAGHIVLGLECGGSDAYSGIGANPALGHAVDLLVSHGGTAILSETPEIYGAEHLLTRRAQSPETGQKLIRRIRWWEEHTARLGGEINNNPTPGNKAGGLSTILEKSLGAAAKGGTTNLVEVYEYAEPVTAKGLVFMDTPGYDPVSVTGMVAGGATMVCFTTGRGSVSALKPVPTLKLASNTEMYNRLDEDMDVNCGKVVDGEATIREMGEEIFRLILETASGRPSKSERLGIGDQEFVPWPLQIVV
jgi:altronate hydrolase